VVVFVFYETGPWAAFELELLDSRFDERLKLVDDIELLTSRDDLSPVSIRTYLFPSPPDLTNVLGQVVRFAR
jgi:hypothetical protein